MDPFHPCRAGVPPLLDHRLQQPFPLTVHQANVFVQGHRFIEPFTHGFNGQDENKLTVRLAKATGAAEGFADQGHRPHRAV